MKFKKLSDIIKSLPVKEAWAYKGTSRIEENCMSPFVKNVIKDVAEIIGSEDLEFVDEERFISPDDGRYRADLIFRDSGTNDLVVVENQLDTTDHDHLGKCITYLANIQAKKVVWISEKFRPEHIKALDTLNEITGEDYAFYALELHLMKLGDDSDTYYEFKQIVCPTSVSKTSVQIRQLSRECREKMAYWESFFSDLKELKNSNFNQGKYFHKITSYKKIGATLIFSAKNNNVRIELSTNDENSKEWLRRIAEYINSQFHYDFMYAVGSKNSSIDKWNYVVQDFGYKPEDKENIKQVCINIDRAIKNPDIE